MEKFIKVTQSEKPTNNNLKKLTKSIFEESNANKKPAPIVKRFTFSLDRQVKCLTLSEDQDMISLTSSQQQAIVLISSGKNIFLTGEAGTGKSYLVNRLKELALSQNINLAITALTGTAAYLLGGNTIHSWAQIGLAKGGVTQIIEKINRSKKAVSRWQGVDILIIDEISMMSTDLLDKLEEIARYYRDPNKPFGGIQVILIGDFFQLPPISDDIEGSPKFCFKAKCWEQLIDHNIVLREVIRQSDPVLRRCLSEIRRGKVTPETKKIMEDRVGVELYNQEIKPTRLYPNKKNVEAINNKNLVKLGVTLKSYNLSYNVTRQGRPYLSYNQYEIDNLIKHLSCEVRLTLGVGSQVMLIANLDVENGLVNGSRGIVNEITKNTVKVQFKEGGVRDISGHEWRANLDNGIDVSFSQIPLRLAWAITVHKAQGSSLDLAEIDAGMTIFTEGQTYVALSRVRSLEGLRLIAFDAKRVRANPEVTKFYQTIEG